jgi:hypothetical protein
LAFQNKFILLNETANNQINGNNYSTWVLAPNLDELKNVKGIQGMLSI